MTSRPGPDIPLPPLELRRLVGPSDREDFDNASGEPIYANFGFPAETYDAVFDFGCGCGRVARQLLQQRSRPRRYTGIDAHKGMIDWCRQNLSPIGRNFEFLHHDVYSPGYAPGNSTALTRPFPVRDVEFSLLIAHSVFTHLCRAQAEHYLQEVQRVLRPDGIAFTTWLFFDRTSFPFLQEGPYCLYTSESDFSQAVIYDRDWFVRAVENCGLTVKRTIHPGVAGHQWMVFLERRRPGAVDQFPLGEDQAEWLCGATLKPIATATWSPDWIQKARGPRPGD
jgi:SAM-dependent methyltransferase